MLFSLVRTRYIASNGRGLAREQLWPHGRGIIPEWAERLINTQEGMTNSKQECQRHDCTVRYYGIIFVSDLVTWTSVYFMINLRTNIVSIGHSTTADRNSPVVHLSMRNEAVPSCVVIVAVTTKLFWELKIMWWWFAAQCYQVTERVCFEGSQPPIPRYFGWRRISSNGGMVLTQEDWNTWRETWPIASSLTTNPSWTGFRSNQGLYGQRPPDVQR